MQKISARISAFVSSVLLLLASSLSAMPVAHAVGSNLISNPSVETSASNQPTGWANDSYGKNTHAFSYTNTGHTGSHALNVSMTARTGGDAKWYFTPVAASPNTSYTFSDWYQSNVASSIDVVVTSTSNVDSYLYQGDQTASSTWKQASYTFKTPANAAKITVYHYLQKVGSLTTDDYSLINNSTTTTPTAPTVAVSAPAAGSTVSGTTTLSATASDAVAVSSVQFKVDGANVGAADTTTPYSVSWDSKTVANGTHAVTAVATNSGGLSTTSAPVSTTVSNTVSPTAPAVSVTAPTANATVSGTATLSANASDTAAVSSVQFKVDGANVGSVDTVAPYTMQWDSKTVANGAHAVTAVATNSGGLSTTSSPVSINVSNVAAPTAPAVSVTSPTANSTVSGTTSLTASASDSGTISSVQFKVDGASVGAAVTATPYTLSWNSTTVANGTHSITATATNNSNLSTTSTPVSVTVSNTVTPASPNLIANPSAETATTPSTPDNWLYSQWGTNTSTATYLNTGHTGSHSLKVQTTKYTNGSANWYYNDIPVTAGKTYQYSNWYQSNVDTEVDAEVTMNDGTVQYFYVGTVFANANWTQFKTTFSPPAGAKSMALYQILAKVGYITSDDYSLTEYTPVPYNRGIVSVTFDDGWANQYQNAYPVLQQLGIKSTFYIISGELADQPDYMSSTQVKNLYASGNEIASHSVTHPDFTTLTSTQVTNEFKNSQTTLQNLIGAPITDFAYPYGAYNQSTLTEGAKYYATQRTVNGGYNTKDNLDVTQLKMYEVDSDVSQATVQGWIDSAKAQNVWLILCYHEVANTPTASDDALYTTSVADYTAEMNYLKNSGVSTQTIHQALTEVQAQ